MIYIYKKVKMYIYSNRKMLWYLMCFACLGLIDQRKQSAPGVTQMFFGNSTSLVMAALLLPSVDLCKFRQNVYMIWTPICALLVTIALICGKQHMTTYMLPWIPVVCGGAVWSYLFLYIVREWKSTEGRKRIRQPFFWCILLILLLMIMSVNKEPVPYWYLMMYGGLYLIGIRKEERPFFFSGLLNGVIIWFFVQQMLAFGFRPYDSWRYKGMYAWVTFNGLFYMIVYCAVLLKWLITKEQKAHWSICFLWFFLSTGCVSFAFLAGGRSALVGILLSTIVLYGWYDLKHKKSFYRLLLHAVTWLLCVVVTYPLVYGCVRYLPTILHHPIWFEGEYSEGISVCSFDTWDSDKYTTFKIALDMSAGRIFELLGIDLWEEEVSAISTPFIIRAYAAENIVDEKVEEERTDKVVGMRYSSGVKSRESIYISCLTQLNWSGHVSGVIQAADGNTYDHAHNMFLDMAYRHGILAGVLYLGICIYSILQALWRRKPENIILVVFMLGLLSFGMFEQLAMMGQFGVALIWILFYFAGEDSKMLFDKKHA